jgi:hypothetical protein
MLNIGLYFQTYVENGVTMASSVSHTRCFCAVKLNVFGIVVIRLESGLSFGCGRFSLIHERFISFWMSVSQLFSSSYQQHLAFALEPGIICEHD